MLTTTRDLWFERAAWQYWQLTRVLFFNFKVVGYVSVFFLLVAAISYVAGLLFPLFGLISSPLVFLALCILLFVGVIMLPMGILSLLTNRHAYTLPNLRSRLFVILCCFCAFFSLVMPVFIHRMDGVAYPINSALTFFLLGALYFWLATYLARQNLFLFGLAPVILGVIGKLGNAHFSAIPPLSLLLMCLTSWGLFYLWWSRFRLVKTNAKSILIETDPKILRELPIEKLIHFSSSNHVKTPIGTLLLGYGDGFSTLLKKQLVIYATSLLFALFVCGAFKSGEFSSAGFNAVLISLAYSFLISGIDFFSQRMLVNMRRCWPLFTGNRTDLFLYIERYFLCGLRFLVLLNASVLCVFLLLTHSAEYFWYCMGGLILLAIVLVGNFYSNIYFYKRDTFVYGNLNFYKLLTNAIYFIPTVVYLVSKYGKPDVFELVDGFAIGFALLLIASFKIIRAKAIRQWLRAEF